MLSDKLADLSELVLGEDRIPPRMRADFASLLADYAEQAAALECGPVPRRLREVPAGCIDLSVARAVRRAVPR